MRRLWLVKSDTLGKHVRVIDWPSEHSNVQVDAVEASFASEMEYGDLFADAAAGDTDDVRHEKINAADLQTGLTRLRIARDNLNGRPLTPAIERELRQLDVLEKIDSSASEAKDGIRLLCVVYAKRSGIGRRSASYPSMQSCPSSLRPLLQRMYYHDIDIVNCHPNLMMQEAEKAGNLHSIPKLVEYVTNRDEVLQRIADHFQVDKAVCKFVVLRVLNGGTVTQWCIDIGLPPPTLPAQPDLEDLAEEARIIRAAFFQTAELKRPGVVDRLRGIVRSRKGPGASVVSIDLSVFSYCISEIEDSVLGVVDACFRGLGWAVGSLIYDGLHVEHCEGDTPDPSTTAGATQKWTQLESAMRQAEAAVLRDLGYKIRLCEKPFFEMVDTPM